MSVGGGEKLVRSLCRKTQISGCTHQIVCFDRIDAFENELSQAGIPLSLVKRRQCLFDYRLILPLIRMIKKNRIQLIHAHDLSSLSYAVVAGSLAGSRVVMTEHSRHYIDGSRKRRLEKQVLIMGTDRLIEVSTELKRASISRDKIPSKKIEVIENGVDIDRFKGAVPAPLYEELNIPRHHTLILTVGRLESIKGQQYLVKAMSRLKNGDCHLVLAGDGSNRNNLEKRFRAAGLGDIVHFLGSRDDIPELMAACDILVMPSESEGLPFVLLEAMAAGLPVVATKVGQIPDILGNGKCGILVPPKESCALASAFNG